MRCPFDCIIDPRSGILHGDCRIPWSDSCFLATMRKKMSEVEMIEYDALSPEERAELAETGESVKRFLKRKKDRDLYAEIFAGDTSRGGR